MFYILQAPVGGIIGNNYPQLLSKDAYQSDIRLILERSEGAPPMCVCNFECFYPCLVVRILCICLCVSLCS